MDHRFIEWIAQKIIAGIEADKDRINSYLTMFLTNPEVMESTVRSIMFSTVKAAQIVLGSAVFYNSASEVDEVIRMVRKHFASKPTRALEVS